MSCAGTQSCFTVNQTESQKELSGENFLHVRLKEKKTSSSKEKVWKYCFVCNLELFFHSKPFSLCHSEKCVFVCAFSDGHSDTKSVMYFSACVCILASWYWPPSHLSKFESRIELKYRIFGRNLNPSEVNNDFDRACFAFQCFIN